LSDDDVLEEHARWLIKRHLGAAADAAIGAKHIGEQARQTARNEIGVGEHGLRRRRSLKVQTSATTLSTSTACLMSVDPVWRAAATGLLLRRRRRLALVQQHSNDRRQ
jgi:hypothetical protein